MKFIRQSFSILILLILFPIFSSMNQESNPDSNQPIEMKGGEKRDFDPVKPQDHSQSSRKFQLAYTVFQDSHEITPIDLQTGMAGSPIYLENETKSIVISPNGLVAYVILQGSNEVLPVDLVTGKALPTMSLEKTVQNMLISGDGKSAYVIYEDAKQINTIDLATGEQNILISLEGSPIHISQAPDCKTLYVCYEGLKEITPIEIDSSMALTSIPLNDAPKVIAITPDGGMIYVGENSSKKMMFYDLEKGELKGSVTLENDSDDVEKKIQNIHVSLDGKLAYLTQENSSQIVTVDLTTLTLNSSINIDRCVKNIAIYPKEELVASFSENIGAAGEATAFDASKTVPFKGAIIGYEWNFGDGHVLTTESPYVTHKYESIDKYDVTLTVTESMEAFPLEHVGGEVVDKILPLIASTTKSIEILKNLRNHSQKESLENEDFDLSRFAKKIKAGTPAGPLLLFDDTITTISSSATPAVFGEPITFTSTVTPAFGTGIPTGLVSFVDTILGTIGTGTLDINGVATFTTSALAVGSYSLSANYEGDVNYNPSSSAPPQYSQVVNQALTTTSVVASPNPSIFSNSVTLTATVSVVSPGAGTPSGIVTFYDGVTSIGTGSVSGGQATLALSTLSTGSHSISAVYEGDVNFLTSPSTTYTQTVNKASTATSVATSLSPSPFGNSVTFTATVTITNGTGTTTGTVTFKDGSTTLGTQPVSSGTATFATTSLAVGSHNITAIYNGDVNFATSTSTILTEVISQGTTTTTLISSLNPSTYGQSITFTANVFVATGTGVPTGTVTFKDGATALGTSTLNGSDVATLSIFNLSVNTHSITAIYNGDTNFSTSTSSILSQVVDKATPIVTVASSLSPSNYGDLVTFTSTVSAPTTLGLPTGTVLFYDGLTLLGSGSLTATGANTSTATYALSTLNAGTHSITAQYIDDINFTSGTSSIFSQTVNSVVSTNTIIFSNSPNPSEYGESVVLRATVTGSTASPPLPPTGVITFFDGATPIGTVAVVPVSGIPNASTTSLSVSSFAIGSHVITAKYFGDVNYPASPTSLPMTQTIIQTSTSSAVVTSITPSKFGQNVTFTVTVNSLSPGAGAPSGTVEFYDLATFLGTSSSLIPGVNSSTATFSTSSLSLGSHTIIGIYSGDVNFTSSSAPVITQNVIQDATSTLITGSTSSPAGFDFGDNITFTAAVTASAPGSGTPTGTVQFFEGATLLGTGTLSSGIATFTTVKLYPTPPDHSITAIYSGDTNFTTSTSPIFLQSINSTLPTTTTITGSSRNSSPFGASHSVTYTATVVAAPGPGQGIPGIPTGTVTFTDTTLGLVIGTGTLNANGVATITESGSVLSLGLHQIEATYNGQAAVFDPSTSVLFDEYIVPLDTTTTLVATPNHLTPPTHSTQAGATLVATVNVVGGVPPFPNVGTVTFYEGTTNLGTVAVNPIDGTATLNPNDLHFGSDTLTAVYSGDITTFAMSTSNPVNLQVQQTDMLTTATTISSSLASSVFCQPVTFTAVVVETQGFYTPTGSVTFFDGTVEVGTAILDNTGTAKLIISDLSVGTHSMTATYNSDSNYAFSFANTITQTITANNTSTTFILVPTLASTPYGEDLILSATVASTSAYAAIPTGTVTFSHGSTTVATVPLNSSGQGVYIISTIDVGTYTFVATYNPDPCFNSSQASLSHTITKVNPLTTFTTTSNPSTYGDAITLNATVTSLVGTPTGSVTFYNGATALGTEFLQGGSASIQIPSPLAGIVILYAKYNGDGNFLTINTASVQQTINKVSTSTCLKSFTTNPSVYGEMITFNATVSSIADDESPGLTGSVTFKNGAILLGTVSLDGCNTAILETSSLNLGTSNNVVATYSGDSNFATSASSALNLTVLQASTITAVTSITSSPNPAQFGTLVTFNVSVNATHPGSGVPTGIITGFYGTTSLGTGTLVNGVASFSTSILPVGVQPIIVKYSGDTNFTASQTTTTETVVAVATTSTLTSTANPSVFGQPVTFNVTVSSSQGTPTGTVSFLDGTTTLATQTLNSTGSASFTISSLSVSTHSIKAVYSGSANLAPSTSSTISQVVNKDPTTTTLTSSLNPSFFGENFTLIATVFANSPGAGTPSGTITFKNGAATIGTGTINSSGQAMLTISTSLAANVTPYSLTAVYSGDGNFITSTGVLSQTINKAATIITATYAPNPSAFGAPVTLNVKVAPINSASGIPTGIVTALYGSQVVGSGTLSINGTVSFLTTSLPAGTLGIVVQYNGDSNFLSSTIPLTETVNTAVSTTTMTSSANPSKVGQPVTFSVNVSSTAGALGIPTGVVNFFDGTNIIGTQGLDASGNTTFTTSGLSLGSHLITAAYSGDATNSSSVSSVLNQVVSQDATTTTLSSIVNPSVYGESVTFAAVVSANAPGSGVPTGTVTFKNGVTVLGTSSLGINGVATFSTSTLPVGANSITAVYNGAVNFATSTSTALIQSVSKTPTITSVASATNPSIFGNPVAISGSVIPLNNGSTLLPAAGTTMTAYYGSTAVGSGTLNASGQYAFSLTNLPAGTLAIEIKYPGDLNFEASTITLTQTVSSDVSTTTIASSLPNPSVYGQTVTITSTVTLASGQTPTGTVTYYDGSTAIGTKNVGQPLTISTLSVGTHPITAVYSGSTNATSSTSSVINQVVNKTSSTTTVVSSLNPSVYGDSVTFTATVTVPFSGTPTGFVTFYNGATSLGVGELDSAGHALFSTSLLPAGSNSITAIYSGDVNFSTSTSSLLTQVVNKAPASATTTTIVSSVPNPSVFGQNVNFFANVSSPNGIPTGTVTYYDGATPIGTVPIYDRFAILSINSLSSGNHSITAVYNGDSNFNASLPSGVYIQMVQPVTITITTVTNLTSLNNPSTFGDPVTFNIQVTSAAVPPPYPTGFVTLYSGSVPLVTLPLNATGGATYTTSALPAGNLVIVAFYSGDSTFSSSTDVISQVVNPLATTTSLVSSLNPSNFGEPVMFTATIASGTGNPTPTGSVSFYDGATLMNTSLLSTAGVASFVTPSLSTGSHAMTAIYNADPNFGTSNANITQIVNKGTTTTTILTSSPNPSNLGDSVTFIASTSAISGVPSGLVTFYDGATPIGSSSLFGGLAIFSTSALTTGSHSMTASYAGNGNYQPSTSLPFIQKVINGFAILQPPRGFCGCQTVSKYLNKTDRVNVLTWNAPGVGAEPKFYKIYRNKQLTDFVAFVPACGPLKYEDNNREKGKKYTYYLVAGNQNGISAAVSVTVDPRKKHCCSMVDLVSHKERFGNWHLPKGMR